MLILFIGVNDIRHVLMFIFYGEMCIFLCSMPFESVFWINRAVVFIFVALIACRRVCGACLLVVIRFCLVNL